MRVQKFTHEGKFLLTWGSEAPWGRPALPEQLLYPSGLAVGPDGNIYVTDSGHDRIKVFSPKGKFIKEWGVKGIKPGDLNAAAGLAFDAEGRLHEADAANHRVQIFTPQGRFLGEWFLPNAGNLKVWSPANLRAVTSQFLCGLNFVNLMLKLVKERDELRIVDDEVVSPTSTAELAKQIVLLSRCDNFGLYHATSEGSCSWYEFAREIFAITRKEVNLKVARPNEFSANVPRPKYSVLENRPLKTLGLNVFRTWQECLRSYLSRDTTE